MLKKYFIRKKNFFEVSKVFRTVFCQLHYSCAKIIDVPRADDILAYNLKGRSSSSAASIETIQLIRERQNTRLSFSCWTNRHPGAFTKLFYANRWKQQKYPVSYSLHALTSQNVERNATSSSPYIKTFSNCCFVAYQSPSKKNSSPSNSTSHGQEIRNLAKVPYWQCTCPNPSAHLLGTFGHGNIYLFHRSVLKTVAQFVS